MSSSVHDCYEVSSFEQAETVFNNIKPTRSPREVWRESNVRPLKRGTNRTSYTCYRIEKKACDGKTYYDIVLYNTIIARYHEPTVNASGQGERVIYYNYYKSQLTYAFMQAVLNKFWRTTERTITGTQVVVPIGFSNSKHRTVDPIDNATFTLRRVLVETSPGDFVLDTSRSYHTKFYTKVSTDADKQRRAAIRKRVESIVDLACMRLPTMEQDAKLSYQEGRPFGGDHYKKYKYADWCGLADPDVLLDDAMTQDALNAFLVSAQSVYNTLASKRLYAEGGSYNKFRNSDPTKLSKPVTEGDFRTRLMRFILDQTEASKRNGKKYLPMWAHPDEWPSTGIYAE